VCLDFILQVSLTVFSQLLHIKEKKINVLMVIIEFLFFPGGGAKPVGGRAAPTLAHPWKRH
jgi:hypothetical protein